MGERGRINDFMIGKFKFDNLLLLFSSSSLQHVKIVPNRVGSVGGEVLKVHGCFFDYPSNYIYLRKNKIMRLPFLIIKAELRLDIQDYNGSKRVLFLKVMLWLVIHFLVVKVLKLLIFSIN
jgi:hypothetical protein